MTVLQQLESKGVQVGLAMDGENLRVHAGDPLTDIQRAYIRRHKAELLSEIRDRVCPKTPGEYIKLLAPCEVLPDDIKFLEKNLPELKAHRTMMLERYRQIWEQAAAAEALPHKKQNAGRSAANIWLRTGATP